MTNHTNSQERAFAQNVKSLFIVYVVSGTFAGFKAIFTIQLSYAIHISECENGDVSIPIDFLGTAFEIHRLHMCSFNFTHENMNHIQ